MLNMIGKEVDPNAPKFTRVPGRFGCSTCLWAGIECKNGSMFQKSNTSDKSSPCDGYTYYD